ncbi:hypothetical protein K402DRAFT_417127 [Aulographum hederae CBS 113979]|uniref:Uncharacterized protein n=1 Tax=Aulographum hederae CBS 113979 TaxID=1176131 RepID=A0A6G1HDB0_9PEZI|nr:hypothetical protein K402DRAFT_417127 [Aulographum hederae CBS 113979]
MESTKTATETADETPKRVILRLRVNELSERGFSDHHAAIDAYLAFAGRPPFKEFDYNKHHVYIEPFQDEELNQTSLHIVLDFFYPDLVTDPHDKAIQHELYRVRRDGDGNFQVTWFKNPLEAKNYIVKARDFLDMIIPWGNYR